MRAGRGREGGMRPVRAGPVCTLRAHLLQLRSRGLRPVRPRRVSAGVGAGVGAGPPRGSECGPWGRASSSSCLPQLPGPHTRRAHRSPACISWPCRAGRPALCGEQLTHSRGPGRPGLGPPSCSMDLAAGVLPAPGDPSAPGSGGAVGRAAAESLAWAQPQPDAVAPAWDSCCLPALQLLPRAVSCLPLPCLAGAVRGQSTCRAVGGYPGRQAPVRPELRPRAPWLAGSLQRGLQTFTITPRRWTCPGVWCLGAEGVSSGRPLSAGSALRPCPSGTPS